MSGPIDILSSYDGGNLLYLFTAAWMCQEVFVSAGGSLFFFTFFWEAIVTDLPVR